VREASKRVLGLRPFDVQLIGNTVSVECYSNGLTVMKDFFEWSLSIWF